MTFSGGGGLNPQTPPLNIPLRFNDIHQRVFRIYTIRFRTILITYIEWYNNNNIYYICISYYNITIGHGYIVIICVRDMIIIFYIRLCGFYRSFLWLESSDAYYNYYVLHSHIYLPSAYNSLKWYLIYDIVIITLKIGICTDILQFRNVLLFKLSIIRYIRINYTRGACWDSSLVWILI